MDAQKRLGRPRRRLARLWGTLCLGALAAFAASGFGQPPTPPPDQPELWLFPQLTQTPNSVFNRLQVEMRTRFGRLHELNVQIETQSEQLEALRRQNHGGRWGSRPLVSLRDQLAALHESVDALVREVESTRAFVQSDVVPQLPTMIEEIDHELSSLPADSQNRNRLQFARDAMQRFAENPDAVVSGFEHGAQGREWGPPDGERGPGGEDMQGSWRLMRRLERIEAQQESLREQLEANDREIQRIRGWLERITPQGDEGAALPPPREAPPMMGQPLPPPPPGATFP